MKNQSFNRRIWVRLLALILVLVLAIIMFHVGKQHTILMDNKTAGDFKALDTVVVQIDKLGEMELLKRDRDQYVVTGQKHKLVVKYTDSNWTDQVIEKTLHLPLNDSMLLLSIPTLVNNPEAPQSEWLTHFELKVVETDKNTDVVVTDENDGLVTDI